MAELTSRKRDDLKDSDFAYVDKKGERHLPVHDEAHVRNVVARFDQTDFEDSSARKTAARQIVRAAERYGIELTHDDAVFHASRD